MTPCPNLLLTILITTIFVLTTPLVLLLPYLSSSYFSNQYAAAAHSSLGLKQTTEQRTIQICCSWGQQIADGILTYRIIGDGGNPKVVKVMHQAIDEWNSKVPNIKLQEITTDNNTPADIDIKTSSKSAQVTRATSTIVGGGGHAIATRKNIKLAEPGEAAISFDANRLITHVDITISTRALGNSISSSELESIAKHEIGHAYGIGHTDFVDDLMSPILITGRTDTSISACDINGIEEANQWKLKGNSTGNNPHAPILKFLIC
jgi:predicted Zn-dependent protease